MACPSRELWRTKARNVLLISSTLEAVETLELVLEAPSTKKYQLTQQTCTSLSPLRPPYSEGEEKTN